VDSGCSTVTKAGKKSGEDSAKQATKREAQKKTAMSNTVPLKPDEVAIASKVPQAQKNIALSKGGLGRL